MSKPGYKSWPFLSSRESPTAARPRACIVLCIECKKVSLTYLYHISYTASRKTMNLKAETNKQAIVGDTIVAPRLPGMDTQYYAQNPCGGPKRNGKDCWQRDLFCFILIYFFSSSTSSEIFHPALVGGWQCNTLGSFDTAAPFFHHHIIRMS